MGSVPSHDSSDAESSPGVPAVDSCTVAAPAKVNLSLNILGRRPDGYHEIDTVMHTVSLTDVLEFRRRQDPDVKLSVAGRTEHVPAGDGNLVIQAARLLRSRMRAETAGVPPDLPGADIHLQKRIPSGAGLGGASSDAASALVGLSELWGVRWKTDRLTSIAAELGSDVPFFVRGGTARCTGRGEKVEWLVTKGELHLVLVFSGFLGTAEIYELWDHLDLTKRYPGDRFPNGVGPVLDLDQVARSSLLNSLEEAAFAAKPGLREVKRELLEAGALAASVSGSGSCVFGVAGSPGDARRIAASLNARGREAVAVESLPPRDLGHG